MPRSTHPVLVRLAERLREAAKLVENGTTTDLFTAITLSAPAADAEALRLLFLRRNRTIGYSEYGSYMDKTTTLRCLKNERFTDEEAVVNFGSDWAQLLPILRNAKGTEFVKLTTAIHVLRRQRLDNLINDFTIDEVLAHAA